MINPREMWEPTRTVKALNSLIKISGLGETLPDSCGQVLGFKWIFLQPVRIIGKKLHAVMYAFTVINSTCLACNQQIVDKKMDGAFFVHFLKTSPFRYFLTGG